MKDWSRCRACRYGMTGPNRMWACNYAEMVGKCKPRPLWDEEEEEDVFVPVLRRGV